MTALQRWYALLPARVVRLLPLIGAAAVLLTVWAGDLADLLDAPPSAGEPDPMPRWARALPLVSGAVAAAAALSALAPRAGRGWTAAVGIGTCVLVSGTTVVLWTLPKGGFGFSFSVAEGAALLLVANLVAYRCGPVPVAVAAVLAPLAVVTNDWRMPSEWWYRPEPLEQVEQVASLAFVFIGPGCYLRWRAAQGRAQAEQVRREERLKISRELHDVVAHQVTGMVVQVQTLRYFAETEPERVATALPAIEEAGATALTSMRRMVRILREADGGASEAPDPAAGLLALERPGHIGRPRVEVRLPDDLAGTGAEVGAALVRIAQEGVTNALRHAHGATLVTIEVARASGTVVLDVRDNGQRRGVFRSEGAGYGLIGVEERARLLGGSCTSGQMREGPGWRLSAELPLAESDAGGPGSGDRAVPVPQAEEEGGLRR
ncbi:hypothetical protein GCM10022205_12360 [Spinactinospora alkalitolerans]